MNTHIGIIYSTTDGQTLKICRQIAQHAKDFGYTADVIELSTFKEPISKYSKLILGASIRYGKHNKDVTEFIKKNKNELNQIYTAFFSVNLVARKSDKDRFNSNPYVIKYFKEIDWNPNLIDVFAGKLDYKSYSFLIV
ncbi:flavodoxin domain-containing protein [Formosa haliotis]|uniref:flavodoxin domain-containing protein n=1 Tax=Formosa haliotis TaxID=1555194 RepID=UPI000A8593CF|nr:flavodoxin domain-containing protein [Formosa haliotis]